MSWKSRFKLAACIIYMLFPRDIIPDFHLPWGFIDDLFIILLVLYQISQDNVEADPQDSDSKERWDEWSDSDEATDEQGQQIDAVRQACRVLGVTSQSTPEEIHDSYKKIIALYHPDKVNHLGQEIQDLAQKKTREINAAYSFLSEHLRDARQDNS